MAKTESDLERLIESRLGPGGDDRLGRNAANAAAMQVKAVEARSARRVRENNRAGWIGYYRALQAYYQDAALRAGSRSGSPCVA
jgi:hypothetical protein